MPLCFLDGVFPVLGMNPVVPFGETFPEFSRAVPLHFEPAGEKYTSFVRRFQSHTPKSEPSRANCPRSSLRRNASSAFTRSVIWVLRRAFAFWREALRKAICRRWTPASAIRFARM